MDLVHTVAEPYGWSDHDKKKLLIGLRTNGIGNLEDLQANIPGKSIAEIRHMIDYYKKVAQTKWLNNESRMSDEVKKWIDIIEKVRWEHQGSVHDLIPRVLKYIALFEKKSKESDVNLSEAYLFLSDITFAKLAKDLPERTDYFIYKCLVNLAENLQNQNMEEPHSFMQQLQNFEELVKKSDEAVINPLSVPDDLLKLTSAETDRDITQ